MHAGLSSRKFVGIRRFAPLKRRGPMHRPRESLVVLLHGAPPPHRKGTDGHVCARMAVHSKSQSQQWKDRECPARSASS